MKISLSLSGGGIKGIAHIGAIKALEEENIKVDYVSGTSSGSIVATLYACGYNADEMHEIFNKYAKDFHYIDFENIKKFFKNIFTGKGIVIDGLNSGTKISKLINEVCSKKGIYNINQIKMPLIIPAVNIETEELYVFSNCKFLLSLTFVVLPMYRIAMKKLHLHVLYGPLDSGRETSLRIKIHPIII